MDPAATQKGAQLFHLPLPKEQNLLGASWPQRDLATELVHQLLEAKEPLSVGAEHRMVTGQGHVLESHTPGPLSAAQVPSAQHEGSGADEDKQLEEACPGVTLGLEEGTPDPAASVCHAVLQRHVTQLTGVSRLEAPQQPWCGGPGTVRSRRVRGTTPSLEPTAGPSRWQ